MAIKTIDGALLVRILHGALDWLSRHRQEIDALNVFPVPDGDTGTNMYATLQSAVAAVGDPPPEAISEAAAAAARGALIGARGNSGVILSQIIQGFATALAGKERADVQDIAGALAAGAEYAYRAVNEPVEGTILTVVRDTAQEASAAAGRSRNLLRLLVSVLRTATRSLAQTPELLPVLKEAGVVDAGGRGFTAILEGVLQAAVERELKAEPLLHDPGRRPDHGIPPAPALPETGDEKINFTYCTEFLLKGLNLDAAPLKEELAPHGDSLLVVGEGDVLRVHVHTDHPGTVLEAALKYGSLHDIRVNNMRDQHRQAARQQTVTAVVAVAAGEGFAALFNNLGAAVVPGGQTMNPSAGEIAAAVEKTGASAAIILPNNPNIILTARQVKNLTGREVRVVPTVTMPQGVAALLAFDPRRDALQNLSRMTEAAERIVTAEVTRAVRDAKISELDLKEGDFIALVGEELAASGADLLEVATAAAREIAADKDLLTIYYGAEVEPVLAEDLAGRLAKLLPAVELETQYGGQPHYHFLLAAE
ncbi:MAG: DAK2 domain-containing protein [Bacillota bacterium]